MNKAMSSYLDAWRFALAMVVFLGHVSAKRLTGGLFWQLGPYTTEAVSVFFVLSGFVIAFVTDNRENEARSYAIARAARIYSVALPALCLTFLLDNYGRAARPDLYTQSWGYIADGRGWQFLSGLLFVNRIWGINVPQGSNLAYWSLGCEVWYYALFGLALFVRGLWKWIGITGGLLIVGPLTALLFPLWLLGVFAYKVCRKRPLSTATGWWLFVCSLILWVAYELSVTWHHRLAWVVPFGLHRPELIQDYIIGSLFVVHLIGFYAVSSSFAPFLDSLASQIRWIAGATFSLYLFHLPIAQFVASQLDWAPADWATRTLVFGGTLASVFILAEVTERRKNLWRAGFKLVLSLFQKRCRTIRVS